MVIHLKEIDEIDKNIEVGWNIFTKKNKQNIESYTCQDDNHQRH